MKKTINIFLLIISFVVLQNCDEDQFESSLNYVSFGDTTYSTGVDVGGSNTIDVYVYTSSKVSSDVTFNIEADASGAADGSYSIPTSVTVPSGSNEGKFTLTLSDVDLGIGINRIELSFTDVTSGYDNGGSTTVEYIQNCTEVTGTLDFVFDTFSDETSWEITDALGGVVLSGGPYARSAGTASESLTLCSGRDYTLTIFDAFGDGMFDGANLGSYTLSIDGEVKISNDGEFDAEVSTAFDTK
ncbi:hypothetical protein [Aestuariibaculum marinum]|uniref:Calx-beta domain-containing protein n=1 Tax=Aestuariibaculum marinum TaxID=2683592 RepID=A0A8J6PWC0_9FLAO|nr:hypothetical protein [Aestuariibaculum marinum]MBD0824167.1 hypothetical protein [Aestuariibaculum marinum]